MDYTTETVMAVIPLGDDREIRISSIHTEEIDFIRIAPFVGDQSMSGAIFPVRALTEVVAGLQTTQRELRKKK